MLYAAIHLHSTNMDEKTVDEALDLAVANGITNILALRGGVSFFRR